MKNKAFYCIVLSLLAILMGSFFSVSAQDIDIENMDNAQLLQLLQIIMQRLEADDTQEIEVTPEPASTLEVKTETGVARTTQGSQFQIWENKKLMIERIPDDRFIRDGGGEINVDSTKEPGKKDKDGDGTPVCPEGAQWVCDIYGRCYCTFAKG